MNTKIIAILLGIAGEAIIALIFFSLLPLHVLPTDIRVLDFIVTTLVYLLLISNILTPMVNMNDPSHKEVGGLGVRWYSVILYSITALLVMAGNLGYSWITGDPALSFAFQAILQGVLLIILLWGLLGSKASIDKTQEVYQKEKELTENKADLKAALNELIHAAEDTPDIPASIKDRLKKLSGEIRYLSPSATIAVKEADRKIIQDCELIGPAFYDIKMNEESINRRIDQLERDIERRKKTY